MASTRVRNSRRDRFRDADGNPFRGGRPLRNGSEIVVRSIDGAGSTIRALRVATKLRLQGSALAAALASPAVRSALADVSYRTGAGHTTGLSVVYHRVEPLTTRRPRVGREPRAEVRGRVARRRRPPRPDAGPRARRRRSGARGRRLARAGEARARCRRRRSLDAGPRRPEGPAPARPRDGQARVPAPADVGRGRRAHGRASRPGPRLRAHREGDRLRAASPCPVTCAASRRRAGERCRDAVSRVLRPVRPSRESSLTPYSDTPRHGAGA